MKKAVFIPFILILFVACNDQTSKKSEYYENDIINNKGKDSIFDVIKTFEDFIKSPQTPKLAKEIYLNKEWNLKNDGQSIALLDSLVSKDANSRVFYFKVITKISEKSDGYFSEGMALAAKEFVENYTKEFLSYFENTDCFSKRDLEIWAKIVSDEFKIIDEKERQKEVVTIYISELKRNCKGCSKRSLKTLSKFILLLNENL